MASHAGDHNLAVAHTSFEAVIIYLLIYGAMNLGAFRVRHRDRAAALGSAEIESYSGLFNTSPAAHRADDDVPRVAGRNPAARRLVRQVS